MKQEILTDIILVDIINFSRLTSSQQLEIINVLTKSYRKVIEKMVTASKIPPSMLIMGYVSTGDGFYCLLDPKLKGYGTFLGLSFNHVANQIANKYPYFQGIKIAVHTGTVNRFKDILGNINYIGDGLNDCARFVEFKHFAVTTVMVSETAYNELKKFLRFHKDYENILQQSEFKRSKAYNFLDKHNKEKTGYLVWLRKSGIIIPPKLDLL